MQTQERQEMTIGILGGMGPYATLDFYRQLLDVTPAKKDWEHLHVLIDSNVKIPSRTRAVLYGEASPVPGMIESINNLARAGAEVVAVPCNSAHFFYEEVVPHIQIPWLNIIDATSEEIRRLGKRAPLVLGGFVTVEKRLYNRRFPDAAYLAQAGNDVVSQVIEDVKLNAAVEPGRMGELKEVVRSSLDRADCVALACTELSCVLSELGALGLPVVDSNLEYAKTVAAFAKRERGSAA